MAKQCRAINSAGNRCKNKASRGSDYCYVESHNEETDYEKRLNPRHEQFCRNFVSREFYGNGVQSYLNAYNLDPNDEGDYSNAKTQAGELLRKPEIYNRINELLDAAGLNDQNVDKQLLYLINQFEDNSAKIRAIQEYNKLKDRVTKHMDLTSGGEPIDGLTFEIVEKRDD